MKRRHIVFTAEVGPPIRNGVVISMESFARGLQQLGHQVTRVVPRYDDSPHSPHYWLYHQIPVPLRFARGYGVALLKSIKKRLVDDPPDIIHTQHMFTSGEFGLVMARRLQIPAIHTYHTYLTQYAHYALLPGAQHFLKLYSAYYANRVDHVIAPSSFIRGLLASYGVTHRMSVVPTGIDPDEFPIVKQLLFKEQIRKKYRLERINKILLYVGRVAREKNIALLLEMLAMVVRKDPHVTLIMVGPGDQTEPCEHAKRLGVENFLIFTGPVSPSEVKHLMIAADVFVFGSLTDTQGIVILEAMAAGCVPVAVNAGGPIDIIEDRRDGRLTSPYPSDFSARVLGLLHNRATYNRLRKNAIKKAQMFSYLHQAQTLVEIYESEIAKKEVNDII